MNGDLNCERARGLLQDDLDGRLDGAERAALRAHVDGCSTCTHESRELGDLRRLFQAVPSPRAPEGFAETVMARVAAQPRGRVHAFPRWVAPLVAVAAVALIAVSVLQRERPSATPEFAASAELAEKEEAADALDDAPAPRAARSRGEAASESGSEEMRDAPFESAGPAPGEPAVGRPAEELEDDAGATDDTARAPRVERQERAREGVAADEDASRPAPRPARKVAVTKDVADEEDGAPATVRRALPDAPRPPAAPEAEGTAEDTVAPTAVRRRVFVAFHNREEAVRFAQALAVPANGSTKKEAPAAGGEAEPSTALEEKASEPAADSRASGAQALRPLTVPVDELRFKVVLGLSGQGATVLPPREGAALLAALTERESGTATAGDPGLGGAAGGGAGGFGAPTRSRTGKARPGSGGGESLDRELDADGGERADDPELAAELSKRVGGDETRAGQVEVVILVVPRPAPQSPASEREE